MTPHDDTPTYAQRITQEYLRMSRTMRLLSVFCVILVVFLLWSVMIDPISTSWGMSAERIEQQVDRIEAASAQTVSQRDAVVAFGPLASPKSRAAESQDMIEAVAAIMAEYGIRGSELNEAPSAVKVGASTLPGIERIKQTLKFETDYETAFDVLAALEASPALEAITSTRIQRGRTRSESLDVEVTLEAWIRGGSSR